MIKKRILHLLLPLALMVCAVVQAQTNPQAKSATDVTTVDDTGGIEAYSDTTSVDTAASVSQVPTFDGWDFDSWSIHSLKDIFNMDVFSTVMIWVLMLFSLLLMLSLPIIIGVIIYSSLRKRPKKVKDIPRTEVEKVWAEHFSDGTIMRDADDVPEVSSDRKWRSGVRTLFLGIGIAVCCYCFGCNKLAGIGWLIAICGAGQALTSNNNKRNI